HPQGAQHDQSCDAHRPRPHARGGNARAGRTQQRIVPAADRRGAAADGHLLRRAGGGRQLPRRLEGDGRVESWAGGDDTMRHALAALLLTAAIASTSAMADTQVVLYSANDDTVNKLVTEG